METFRLFITANLEFWAGKVYDCFLFFLFIFHFCTMPKTRYGTDVNSYSNQSAVECVCVCVCHSVSTQRGSTSSIPAGRSSETSNVLSVSSFSYSTVRKSLKETGAHGVGPSFKRVPVCAHASRRVFRRLELNVLKWWPDDLCWRLGVDVMERETSPHANLDWAQSQRVLEMRDPSVIWTKPFELVGEVSKRAGAPHPAGTQRSLTNVSESFKSAHRVFA